MHQEKLEGDDDGLITEISRGGGSLDSGRRSREGGHQHSARSGSGHETRASTLNLTGKPPGNYSYPRKSTPAPHLRHLRPASPPEGLGIGPVHSDLPLATVAS
jgi:hypothetical protein